MHIWNGDKELTCVVRVSTSRNGQEVAILAAVLVHVHRTKPIVKLGREIDKSNAYNKFERNRDRNDLEWLQV